MEDGVAEKGVKGFVKGKSGNPAGRPKGSKNKTTLIAEQLLEGEAEAITRAAIELAKAGDLTAIKLCLDRLLPPRREKPVAVEVPVVKSYGDLVAAYDSVIREVLDARISPAHATALVALLDRRREALEKADVLDVP